MYSFLNYYAFNNLFFLSNRKIPVIPQKLFKFIYSDSHTNADCPFRQSQSMYEIEKYRYK